MSSLKARAASAVIDRVAGGLWKVISLATAPLPRWTRRRLRERAINRMRHAYLHSGASWSARLGYDEPETRFYIQELVRDGDVFWDIGANVREFALHCWHTRPGAQVIAFEPGLMNYLILQERIREAGAERAVTPLFLALGGRSMLTAICLSSESSASVRNVLEGHTDQYGDVPNISRQPVLAVTADDLVERFGVPAPSHIKLDVDGLEPEILAGATRTLKRVQSVLVEVKGNFARDPAPIYTPLTAAGLSEDMTFRSRWGGENRLFRRDG